ncbi:MAG TPA: rhodanese-like domain-containing protein [Pricia sp.]|nr:rhodanese-like domain-containing protein [Pricia sp.]
MSFWDTLFSKRPEQQQNITLLPSAEFLVAVFGTKVQLVDVRTPREYHDEHINGAINIDWSQPFFFRKEIKKLNKEQPVYLYCRTSNRSQKVAKWLAKSGFAEIYDLQGGIISEK